MATVALVGPGAVGSVFAAQLIAAGHHDVVICARRPFDRFEIESPQAPASVDTRVVTDPAELDGAPVDWVLLAVKAHQTEGARGWMERLCGPDTRVVVIQNGIEQAERGEAVSGGATIMPAVVYCGAELLEPGHVRHRSDVRLLIPAGADADALVALFEGTVASIEPQDDWLTAAWHKLALNVLLNGVTGLTVRPMGVFHEPGMDRVARDVMVEVLATSNAAGAHLPADLADQVASTVLKLPAEGATSMYYDRRAGRPTEHDALHGAVVRSADRDGVDVPVHRLLLALLATAAPVTGPPVTN